MIKRKQIQKLFGEVVRKERKLQKITQSQLAERSNLDNTYISQIERGLANPSIYTLYKIADSLDLSEKEIFQKMNIELGIETVELVKTLEQSEIVKDAIVKDAIERVDAGLLLTTAHNDNYRVIYCNDVFANTIGLKREGIVDRKLGTILADGNNDEHLLNFLSSLEKKPHIREYIKSSHSNGSPLQLEITASPIIGEEEVQKYLFLIKHDFYRKEQNESVNSKIEKFRVLLNETNHRVKNHLTMISGIIGITITDLTNGEVKSTLKDTQLRISSVANIHDLLTNTDTFKTLGFRNYLENLVRIISTTYKIEKSGVDIELDIEVEDLALDEVVLLGLLSNELLTNTYKYAIQANNLGKIKIGLHNGQNGELIFSYSDNGPGFNKKIFHEGETLGFNLVHTFLEQLEAKNITVATGKGFNLGFKFKGQNSLEGSIS